MAGDLASMLGAFFDEELDENPVLASALGAEGFDDRLGDLSAAGFERRDAAAARWLAAFDAADADDARADDRLDRDLVVASLRGRLALRDWASWRRNPDQYLEPGLYGVFVLFLHRLRPDAELAASAAARLRAVPEVLDHGRRNLDPELASPLLVERAKGQCRAAIRYAGELLAAEVGDGDARRELAEAGAVAARAYESFLVFLDDLAARATGTHAVGEERYTTVLRERELLDLDTAGLRRRGQAQVDELRAEMAELCRASGLAADGDWRAAVEALGGDHPATPEEMLEAYAHWTARARSFLDERALVTFPEGEHCEVVPSPHFQRPVLAVASYSMPPPMRAPRTGHFFVPYPPDGTPRDEVRQRLRGNNHHEIPTVAVHEAYPGHHWHLVAMRSSGRPLRAALRSTYFTEGWALYAERMMREQGFFTDPRQELMHLKDRLFRAVRIVVDTGLHAGDLAPGDATRTLVEQVGLPEPTAAAEVQRYCAWPTQASAYLTGSLEIERVRERWLAERRGGLREFHDGIASIGAMPVALHERALLGERSEQPDQGRARRAGP